MDRGERSDADRLLDDMICRDFLRDVCRRGLGCKYKHPSKDEATTLGLTKPDYQFCHDYQNSTCRRANCKFVHCSREEEEYYLSHGQLPERLKEAVDMGIPLNEPLEEIDIPVCKDFLKRACDRGTRCKYRHLSMEEYEQDLERKMKRKAVQAFGVTFNPIGPTAMPAMPDMGLAKRQRFDLNLGLAGGGGVAGVAAHSPLVSAQKAQEENAMLKTRLEELHKQINALQASNEILMQQNARMQMGGGPAAAAGLW